MNIASHFYHGSDKGISAYLFYQGYLLLRLDKNTNVYATVARLYDTATTIGKSIKSNGSVILWLATKTLATAE